MSESTPLVQGQPTPTYLFETHRDRQYRQKVRRLQCYLCFGILIVTAAGLIALIIYSIDNAPASYITVNSTSSAQPSTADSFAQLPDSTNTANLTHSLPIKDIPPGTWDEHINDTKLAHVIASGYQKLRQKEIFEQKVPKLPIDSPAFRHGIATSTSPEATRLARVGFIMEEATKEILGNRSMHGPIGRSKAYDIDWLPEEVCDGRVYQKPCEASPYRTYDGTCNNLKHPYEWGVALKPFRRHVRSHYADDISSPRKATDGSDLPSARNVGLTVHRPTYRADSKFTIMLANWGQFVDHDITATAINQGISCCSRKKQAGLKLHPECFPVEIEVGDPNYERFNMTCMEFVRAAPAPTCSFGPREQLNQASNYIDGSVVYGRNKQEADSLRSFLGGEMKTLTTPDGIELLPISTDPNDGCNHVKELSRGRYCFLTGDARANENSILITTHLLLVRYHNLVARELARINPHWDDERLFQEARKIIAAEMQHIHYNEFLPILLGNEVMDQLKMRPRKKGYSTTYDPDLDATIANEFATSSYRFGHTLLPRLFKSLNEDKTTNEYIEMHKMLFNPFKLYDKNFIENAVLGALQTAAVKSDTLDPEFTQHLFERDPNDKSKIKLPGLDLVALNIQRGRDHGLGGYPEYRTQCGLSRPKNFDDLEEYMDKGSVDRMRQIYKSVDDIDLFTGSVSEFPLNGSLIGPTVTCHLTDQFLRLQRGDRYWYETPEKPQAFTPDQLDTIREITLAKLLCVTAGLDKVQPRVMELTNEDNKVVDCSEFPEHNFSAWKEKTIDDRLDREEQLRLDRVERAVESIPRLAKIGGRIRSGNVNLEGGKVWDGELPIKIPLDLFDAVSETTHGDFIPDPRVLATGVHWNGTISISPKTVVAKGGLEFPEHMHKQSDDDDDVKWRRGTYSFEMPIDWQSAPGLEVSLQGHYRSPIYFHDKKTHANLKKIAMAELNYAHSTHHIERSPTEEVRRIVAPFLFEGSHSDDGNSFLWNGHVVLILPITDRQRIEYAAGYDLNDIEEKTKELQWRLFKAENKVKKYLNNIEGESEKRQWQNSKAKHETIHDLEEIEGEQQMELSKAEDKVRHDINEIEREFQVRQWQKSKVKNQTRHDLSEINENTQKRKWQLLNAENKVRNNLNEIVGETEERQRLSNLENDVGHDLKQIERESQKLQWQKTNNENQTRNALNQIEREAQEQQWKLSKAENKVERVLKEIEGESQERHGQDSEAEDKVQHDLYNLEGEAQEELRQLTKAENKVKHNYNEIEEDSQKQQWQVSKDENKARDGLIQIEKKNQEILEQLLKAENEIKRGMNESEKEYQKRQWENTQVKNKTRHDLNEIKGEIHKQQMDLAAAENKARNYSSEIERESQVRQWQKTQAKNQTRHELSEINEETQRQQWQLSKAENEVRNDLTEIEEETEERLRQLNHFQNKGRHDINEIESEDQKLQGQKFKTKIQIRNDLNQIKREAQEQQWQLFKAENEVKHYLNKIQGDSKEREWQFYEAENKVRHDLNEIEGEVQEQLWQLTKAENEGKNDLKEIKGESLEQQWQVSKAENEVRYGLNQIEDETQRQLGQLDKAENEVKRGLNDIERESQERQWHQYQVLRRAKHELEIERQLQDRRRKLQHIKRKKFVGRVIAGSIAFHRSKPWKVDFPLEIPVNPGFNITTTTTTDSPERQKYAHWTGSFRKKSPKSGEISAQISIPRWVNKNGKPSIHWYNADALFHVVPSWGPNFDSKIFDENYTSPIYFSDRHQYHNLRNMSRKHYNDMDWESEQTPRIRSGHIAPLAFLGTYTDDGKSFLWSGNFSVDMPDNTTDEDSEDTDEVEYEEIPLRVAGGDITVDGQNIWHNDLPVVFPAKYFDQTNSTNNITTRTEDMKPVFIWKGKTNGEVPFITMDGEFSIPIRNDSELSWVNGDFNMLFQSNDTFDLDGPYTTAIYTAKSAYNNLPVDGSKHIHDILERGFSSKTAPRNKYMHYKNYPHAPMLFEGKYSTDNSQFLWSGRCTLALPRRLHKIHAEHERTCAGKWSGFVRKVEITLNGNTIQAANLISNPTQIPLSQFGSVATTYARYDEPSITAHGLLWTANSQNSKRNSASIMGNFSLPSFQNDEVVWYNGQYAVDIALTSGKLPQLSDAKFSSPIHFNERHTVANRSNITAGQSNLRYTDAPAVSPDEAVTAPIVLYGQFTADRTVFLWSGEISVNVVELARRLYDDDVPLDVDDGTLEEPIDWRIQNGLKHRQVLTDLHEKEKLGIFDDLHRKVALAEERLRKTHYPRKYTTPEEIYHQQEEDIELPSDGQSDINVDGMVPRVHKKYTTPEEIYHQQEEDIELPSDGQSDVNVDGMVTRVHKKYTTPEEIYHQQEDSELPSDDQSEISVDEMAPRVHKKYTTPEEIYHQQEEMELPLDVIPRELRFEGLTPKEYDEDTLSEELSNEEQYTEDPESETEINIDGMTPRDYDKDATEKVDYHKGDINKEERTSKDDKKHRKLAQVYHKQLNMAWSSNRQRDALHDKIRKREQEHIPRKEFYGKKREIERLAQRRAGEYNRYAALEDLINKPKWSSKRSHEDSEESEENNEKIHYIEWRKNHLKRLREEEIKKYIALEEIQHKHLKLPYDLRKIIYGRMASKDHEGQEHHDNWPSRKHKDTMAPHESAAHYKYLELPFERSQNNTNNENITEEDNTQRNNGKNTRNLDHHTKFAIKRNPNDDIDLDTMSKFPHGIRMHQFGHEAKKTFEDIPSREFYWMRRRSYPRKVPIKTNYRIENIQGSVIGGSIESQGAQLWSGSFPLSIPMNPSYAISKMNSLGGQKFVNWDGSIRLTSPTTAVMAAQISIPRLAVQDDVSSVDWYTAEVVLDLKLAWWTICEGVLDLEGSFLSPIFFSDRNYYLKRKETPNNLQGTLKIIDETLRRKGGLITPVVLLGSYSADGNSFLWSGNFSMDVPVKVRKTKTLPSPPLTEYIQVQVTTIKGIALRAEVMINDNDILSSNLRTSPLPIPVKLFESVATTYSSITEPPVFAHGLLWSVDLQAADNNSLSLTGNFSLPSFQNNQVVWYNGQFMVDVELTADNLPQLPLKTYSSPVNFIEEHSFSNRTEITSNYKALTPDALPMVNPDISNSAPIALYGQFSADGSIFLWSGQIVINLPEITKAYS